MALVGNIFNFPDACSVDQRIGKELFADNGPLTPADRRTFRNEIEEIVEGIFIPYSLIKLLRWMYITLPPWRFEITYSVRKAGRSNYI